MTPTEVFLTIRAGLSRLDNEVSAFVQSQGIDPTPGSQAATERASYACPESLYTVSAIASILLDSVSEHVTVLVRAMTEPITPFACLTCVRSMLESASIAAWLLDPMVDAQRRVGRTYAHRYEGLEEQVKFGRSAKVPPDKLKELEDLVDKLERDAVTLGFTVIRDRHGKRIGLAERMPSATDIIKLVLDEEWGYRALSAVAHAHTWAMLRLGFTTAAEQPPQPGDGARIVAMEKSVGGIHMHAFSVVRATKALAVPVWNQCLYYGWDKERLVAILESVYDQMNMQPVTRFWR
ncbi:MAG: hypothetical protein IT440_08065 [Phycisphaeraceae bacterium]|nr:hypothetical protein [Phycisphaeraceae bacterium]